MDSARVPNIYNAVQHDLVSLRVLPTSTVVTADPYLSGANGILLQNQMRQPRQPTERV